MRFLLVDRIVELQTGKVTRGLQHITCDSPFLYKDRGESGKLCFASSLIGEALGQLTAWNVMMVHDFRLRPVAGICARARMHRPVCLGETLLLESTIASLDAEAVSYDSVAKVGPEVVFTIEGALGPLLPMEQFIDIETVRRQFHSIHRPGDWPAIVDAACLGAQQPRPTVLADSTTNDTNISWAGPAVSMAFDEVFEAVGDTEKALVAVKKISLSAPYFPDHFPNRPVLPMTVLLQCHLNLAEVFLQKNALTRSYEVQELVKIKMKDFVSPGDIVYCYLSVLRQDEEQMVLRCCTEVDKKKVCMVDIILKPV